MTTFFDRLREERQRLGMSQAEFGAIGGVQKDAQLRYEAGKRKPDSDYLSGIAKAGADVTYILTGIRALADEDKSQKNETAPDLDMGRLAGVIEELEAALDRHRLQLDPARKARAISVLYEYFSKAGPQEAATVDRVLDLMA
jgi:transcriptional regulator with XRE-family HTH domain